MVNVERWVGTFKQPAPHKKGEFKTIHKTPSITQTGIGHKNSIAVESFPETERIADCPG
ncbi:hypothetical cytosolic protein [Syntrophus aciditrophicus SB]|uniref:Hypothetical cytosolic protein n=1 Tax=Syntrophus aciditrophicus (strain SB) TaxID=56780 RepID=Q2LWV9_SYNAS|nr:hypothetical cytosolic protein [Syntrophus aciditrophicus SB]